MLEKLLSDLTNAVSYVFKADGTSPGVLVSRLKDQSYYGSIVRYGKGEGFKNGKMVVCKCKASDLVTVINGLSKELLNNLPKKNPNPIDVLRASIDNK